MYSTTSLSTVPTALPRSLEPPEASAPFATPSRSFSAASEGTGLMPNVSVPAVAFHAGADRIATIVVELSSPFGIPCITCACTTWYYYQNLPERITSTSRFHRHSCVRTARMLLSQAAFHPAMLREQDTKLVFHVSE